MPARTCAGRARRGAAGNVRRGGVGRPRGGVTRKPVNQPGPASVAGTRPRLPAQDGRQVPADLAEGVAGNGQT